MVNLHVRSCFTLLNSTMRINDIVNACVKNNQRAVGLCDKYVMHGAMAFYHACKKANIKPIFGLEITINDENNTYGFVLYAKNNDGFKNLMKISTIYASSKSLTLNELDEYDHLVIGLISNEYSMEQVSSNSENEIGEVLFSLSKSFKKLAIALTNSDSPLLKAHNQVVKKCAKDLGLTTFALSKTYYANKEDESDYQILCAIDQQTFMKDATLNYKRGRYFRSDVELSEIYDDDDLKMCELIADNCNVDMSFEKADLPHFKNKYDVSSDVYLKDLCIAGLKKRLNNKPNSLYNKRLEYELSIITKMNYADYFLIVYDFISYSRSHDIYVGPGRGSAAGSLIAYCLGITQVDPIKYDLLFERFLNPMRISMPDIDVDFPDNRREEVIEYVKEKYGDTHVAHIVTFGTLGAKQVIRDVGKVKGISINDINQICRVIPFGVKMNLKRAYESSENFRKIIESKKELRDLFQICLRLEGLPRHSSIHAAGIILSNKNIEEVCPLMKVEDDLYTSQYTMEYLEELGLIKMDFLGLRNLTIIDEVINHIKKAGQSIDIMKIDLNDSKSLQLIRDVDTVGVFQLESEGMKNLIKKMQPKNFEEIAAAIALFRPGPMENIPLYLKNRNNPEQINYLHDDLKPILKSTYGVMIYQEQIMQVAQKLAGFSLGEADILRKAMSKKKSQEMEKMEASFKTGMIKNGYSEALTKTMYQQVLKFAGYGFNKSHSIAYALISFQMAYLKANYPLNFFSALLDSVIGSEIKTSEYIYETKKRKVKILPPSINLSSYHYLIEDNAIRFPLLGIKKFGFNNAEILISEREKNGAFKDYQDFIIRMTINKMSKTMIELLIDAGALDEFKQTRASSKYNLDATYRYAQLYTENTLIDDPSIIHKTQFITRSDNSEVKSDLEKKALGFYLSEHPISKIRNSIDPNLSSMIELNNKKGFVKFVCQIEKIKQHRTKKGDYMAFVVASDETGTYDLAIMPKLYTSIQNDLARSNYFYVEGKIDDRDSVLVNKMSLIDRSNYE